MSKTQNVQALENLYIFKKSVDVCSFLEEHTFLFPLLVEAYQRIRDYFPDAPIMLEVSDSHDKARQQLNARIVTNLPVEHTLDKMDQLDKNWWLRVSGKAQKKLSFGLHYV